MASDYESMRDILPFLEIIHKDFSETRGGSSLFRKLDQTNNAFKIIFSALHNGNTIEYLCNKIEALFRCGSDDVPLKALQFLFILKSIMNDELVRYKPNDNILTIGEYCKNELGLFDSEATQKKEKSEYVKGREDLASELLEIISEEKNKKEQLTKKIEEEEKLPKKKKPKKIKKSKFSFLTEENAYFEREGNDAVDSSEVREDTPPSPPAYMEFNPSSPTLRYTHTVSATQEDGVQIPPASPEPSGS